MSARWALYRYFWAFAPPAAGANLRLSTEASSFVHHHKTALSEHLGIAFALELGRSILRSRHPGCVVYPRDVDRALTPGAAPLGIGPIALSGTRRPDYLMLIRDASGHIDVVALEAKGTHERSYRKTQLNTALAQLDSVTTGAPPVTPDGLAFAAYLSTAGIEVIGIDPPAEQSWAGPPGPRRAADDVFVWLADDSGRLVVGDLPAFRRALLSLEEQSLLVFAGRAPGDRPGQTQSQRAQRTRATRFGDVESVTSVLALSDGAGIALSFGASVAVLDAIESRDDERILENTMAFASEVQSDEEATESDAVAYGDEDGTWCEVVLDDGSFTRIELV